MAPKAIEKMEKDRDELIAVYAFPAAHWVRLKTTQSSPTSSPFVWYQSWFTT